MGSDNGQSPVIFNCHTHIFTNRNVPDDFLPFGLLPRLRGSALARALRGLSEKLYWLPYMPRVGRLFAFLGVGDLPSAKAIFKQLQGYYPSNTRFVLLSLDMDFMGAGRAPEPFLSQLQDLVALKKHHPDTALPFIYADLRRSGVAKLVKAYIEDHGFSGIKLYPPLGFYPFDERLDDVFAYAEAKGIPVIAHCSRGGVYLKTVQLPDVSPHPLNPSLHFKPEGTARLTDHFANPRNYALVLAKFPNLKLCLAHFGGADEWSKYLSDAWSPDAPRFTDPREVSSWFTPKAWSSGESWLSIITNLVRAYPNVYTDSSYTSVLPWSQPLLKVLINTPELRPRILFGTDFYMVRMAATERVYSVNLRGYLGEKDFMQIAHHNPHEFLRTSPRL